MGYRCPLPLFVPLNPPSWLPFTFVWGFSANSLVLIFGWFFLFYFRSLFFFQLVNSIGSIRTIGPTNWRHSYWRDPPCLCKGKIKSKRKASNPSSAVPIFQAPASPFTKLHQSHFPGSTVSIFQAPPSPFSRLLRPYFPSSAVRIFLAPPFQFSKLHQSHFPSPTVPSQLKSFLLKRSILPLLRQDQNNKSKKIQTNLQLKSPSTKVISLFLDMNGFQLSMDKVSNQLKTFLTKRSSLPLQRQDQSKSPWKRQAPPSPFSKLHRSHFPGSTISIFQSPPSPSSTARIFQAPPSLFSKLRRLRLHFQSISRHSINLDSKSKQLESFLVKTFMPTHRQTRHPLSIPLHSQLQPFSPSTMESSVSLCLHHMVMGDNLSKLLKSFLLKKLLRPLRRLEQPMMSIETLKIAQDKHQLITNGTHTPIISQLLNRLKYNNSLLYHSVLSPTNAFNLQRVFLPSLWHKIIRLHFFKWPMRYTSNQVSLLFNQSLLSMLVTSYQGKHRGNLLTSGHIHGLSLEKPTQKIFRVLSCHFLSTNTCV